MEKLNKNSFNGILVPAATTYAANGSFDQELYRQNLQKLVESGIRGVVVLGSNGEFPLLYHNERLEAVAIARQVMGSERLVIVGTGCESLPATEKLNQEAADLGADAVLIITPWYYKKAMNDQTLYDYYWQVADRSSKPVLLYNMPANAGVSISPSLATRLAAHSNIIGIKESSGNIVGIGEMIYNSYDQFAVIAGSISFLLPAMSIGACGGIVALGNVVPRLCVRLFDLISSHKHDEARKLQLQLIKLNSLVTGIHGIGGLKFAMELAGFHGGLPRLPLQPPGADAQKDIRAAYEELLRAT